MEKLSICVVGMGYIGLPTAALLAKNGMAVIGCDVSVAVVETINDGRIHIVEPDLDEVVRVAVASGLLKAATKPAAADVFIICVPTPFYSGEGIPRPNIDYVLAATKSIAPYLKANDLVILESTSPVGTTAQLAATLELEGVDISKLHIAYCPERVLPGRIMVELVENDRIVGGLTPEATDAVAKFYQKFVDGDVLKTTAATAEMCKLAENSYRDVNIAFANELSMICAKADIDIWEVIKLANHHPRVNILQPGTGVGGHCIAVDPWFIVARDPETARLIKTARNVNDYKTVWVVEQILVAAEKLQSQLGRRPTIACLGLAFKPDIDDLRESPALAVYSSLQGRGNPILAVEPNISGVSGIELTEFEAAVISADLICVLVNHRQFSNISLRCSESNKLLLNFCAPALAS